MEKEKKPQQASPSSPPPLQAQYCIDIHEDPHRTAGANGQEQKHENSRGGNNSSYKTARPTRVREHKKSFSRQVSLETGFSALRGKGTSVREYSGGEDNHGTRSSLPRSGRSLGAAAGFGLSPRGGNIDAGRRRDFNMFRTKSTLAKQSSLLPMMKESDTDHHNHNHRHNNVSGNNGRSNEGSDDSVNKSVPAGRYFAALTGPELDQVKDHEDILLPKDEQWPFLLRFPIGSFGICLGLSSQSILWQSLSTSPATRFLKIPPHINLLIWLLAVLTLLLISTTYILKSLFYFEAVRREYFHPVRVNFFFAPWVVLMFLTIGTPKLISPGPPHPAIFCLFMAPIFLLELKIYGQWLSGGKRRLSKVANPSTHLSVVGNFVGAILAAKAGWIEPAKFFWAVGFAHYMVLFVTLYQRLPTSEVLPKELHPVYSMFIAAPSAASIAWENIYGEFDGTSRTCYFIALFLYTSLVVRINFFWGFRFSVAWWSYTFPMTTASIATIKYAEQVPSVSTKVLALSLSLVSSTMVSVLFVSTLLHAFVWRTLFPNDLAIAITKRKHGKEGVTMKKPVKRGYDIRKWAKQTPLSIVSSAISKNTSISKDDDADNQHKEPS